MKRLIKLSIALIMLIAMPFTINAMAKLDPLDVINSYTVTITPNDDASLIMHYELEWQALVDGDESCFYVGIPNRMVEVIDFDDRDVISVDYSDHNGDSIKLELYKSIEAGKIYHLDFTIHQEYMFDARNEDGVNYVNYEFTPGWFDDIEVKNLTVLWDKTNVIEADSSAKLEGNYYKWSYHLNPGERIECKIVYEVAAFPNIDLKTEKGREDLVEKIIIIAAILVVVIAVVASMVITASKAQNSYYASRGFVPYYRHHYFFWHNVRGRNKNGEVYVPPVNPSTGGSRGGGGCACACACACAGGGRAGCSRKDFYRPKLNTKDLDKALGE